MENLLLAISSGHHAKRQQHFRSQHVVFGVLTLDLFDLQTWTAPSATRAQDADTPAHLLYDTHLDLRLTEFRHRVNGLLRIVNTKLAQ